MASPSIYTADAKALASDALQAAHFRGTLAGQRATITGVIAGQNDKLATMSIKMTSVAVSRLRRQIRKNEAECRHLDHMIVAIDRRFSSQWARRP